MPLSNSRIVKSKRVERTLNATASYTIYCMHVHTGAQRKMNSLSFRSFSLKHELEMNLRDSEHNHEVPMFGKLKGQCVRICHLLNSKQ